jgi:alpha-1,2-glucosyltransferase
MGTVTHLTCACSCRYAHPYLLADNRHWSSTAWRHLLGRAPWQRYLYVPAYAASLLWLSRRVGDQPALVVIGGVAAIAMVLVPAPLIEARYLTLPYLVWRVHAGPAPRPARIAAEAATYAVVNTLVLGIFLFRPFVWSHAPAALQRMMW